MGAELGRISGPLLSANLLRNGVDLAFETDLLYLDVNNNRIGINTDTPSRLLNVSSGIFSTNLISDAQADIADLIVALNKIQNISGSIVIQPNQTIDPKIVTTKISTLNLEISDQLIANITPDLDIELSPSGTGRVIFNTSEVDITGSLHATGNITWDGNIIFGDGSTDNVSFNSDISSNLIPDATATYDLGTLDKTWNKLYVEDLKVDTYTSNELSSNNIDLLLTQGNTIYVSINGLDTNTGEHQHSTFRTIKHALSLAQPGDEIVIFPGTYEEIFPLIVPQGVSVKGAGIRSVTVKPTVGTNTNDAFLLNGETTVSYLTVKDFFYDSVNNTGYAFRFADNITVSLRSPYVFQCTVITSIGTNPAGRGILLDGSVATVNSREAAGLFFSVTLIVPGSDGITVTNGARCEWLNSFTYFADKGIHLTQGTLGFASQGLKFGAEMRSINSANVYGTYGAVADGADTLGYLIGHNFGYIGSGLDSSNDRGLVIQANEVLELNDGQIYYDSMDHKGDYRIGDVFYVNQETGQVNFFADSIDFGSLGNITLESPDSITIIDKDKVQTGNLRFYDNNIDSLIGSVNFLAFSGNTYLNTNVNITGSLSISDNVKVSGNVFLGDDPLDLVTIAPNLTQNIVPNVTSTYTLGTDDGIDPKRWNVLYNTVLNIDNVIDIQNNTISTLTADTDLILDSLGTGIVNIQESDVLVDQSILVDGIFTVQGSTSVKDLFTTGLLDINGNIDQTGNSYVTGTFLNNGNMTITGNSYFRVNSVEIFNNNISATATNNDIIFSGKDSGNVNIEEWLTVTGSEIQNTRTPLLSEQEASLLLSPNGTGIVDINSTTSLLIPVGNDATRILSQEGEIRYNSATGFYEGWQPSGLSSFYAVYDSDRNTYITPELTRGNNDNTFRFGINGSVKATLDSTALRTNKVHIDQIEIYSNTIRNLNSSNDLVFSPNGQGYLNLNNVGIRSNEIVNFTNGALVLATTGLGYVKFSGTGAVYMPYGDSVDRRSTPEVGEIRNNTTLGYMEVYSGNPAEGDNGWIPAIGTSGAASLETVNEIMDIWTIILG